jgi:ATP-binding cassette subfamily B protein
MKSLGKLLKYALKYKWAVLLSLLAMLIQVITGFLIPSLMKVIIDDALPTKDLTLLRNTGLLMVLVAFIGLAVGIFNTFTSQRVAMNATRDLRNDLFRKIQSLSAVNIDKFKTSRLITTSTSDVVRMQQFFQMMLRIIVRAPLMVGIGLFMAIQESLELSNIFFISLPLLMISIAIIVVIAFPRFSKVQKTVDGLNKVSLETANSPRVIKSFVSMKHENKRFNDANELFRTTNTSAEKVMVFAEPIIMLIFNASLAGIILLGAYYIDQGVLLNFVETTGEWIPAVGVLIAFNNYMMQILFGLMMFAMVMIFISRALASAKRIVEVLDEEVDLQNCEDCIENFDITGEVEFKNVAFSYEKEGNNVLHDISFKVKAGQRVGIIGSTGSGKSTLISLIPRLYDVSEGEILIDGKNIKQLNIKSLRNQISVVTQTATLFSGSIGTNLLQGKKDATIDELEEASTNASALEFIEEYDDLYNHEVQQKGTNFSGGQKQRISLARAFIRKPKIMILDDSTSAVDAKSEEIILDEINRLSQNMTTLVISQKISSIRDMDNILVLNNKGMIDGFDTHQNLLKNSKVYQEIALSQLGTGGDLDA